MTGQRDEPTLGAARRHACRVEGRRVQLVKGPDGLDLGGWFLGTRWP